MLVTVDDNASDACFQNLFLGIYHPNSRRYFSKEDVEAFTSHVEHTTSKKEAAVRRLELM